MTVLVGPEGGLAPEEREIAVAAGFQPVRFGPRVLRTETAPLAALAALQAIFGDCYGISRDGYFLVASAISAIISALPPRFAISSAETPSRSFALGSTPRPAMKSCAASRSLRFTVSRYWFLSW